MIPSGGEGKTNQRQRGPRRGGEMSWIFLPLFLRRPRQHLRVSLGRVYWHPWGRVSPPYPPSRQGQIMITYCKTWSMYVCLCVSFVVDRYVRNHSPNTCLLLLPLHTDKITGNSGNIPPISASDQDRRG